MRVRLGLSAYLIPLALGFAQNPGKGAPDRALAGSKAFERRLRPDEFFAHPDALCGALDEAGIETRDWDQIGDDRNSPFVCESGHDTGNPDVSALFRVSGDTGLRADLISIAVSIKAASARTAGQEEIGRLVAALFHSINQPEPHGLIRAIANHRYYLARRPYGVVWFDYVTPDQFGFRRVFWFRLSSKGR